MTLFYKVQEKLKLLKSGMRGWVQDCQTNILKLCSGTVKIYWPKPIGSSCVYPALLRTWHRPGKIKAANCTIHLYACIEGAGRREGLQRDEHKHFCNIEHQAWKNGLLLLALKKTKLTHSSIKTPRPTWSNTVHSQSFNCSFLQIKTTHHKTSIYR